MNTSAPPKDRLFQTAARLFYRHGYRAVGVDTIAAESGIGKMTLYRHFPSKDDLILAFLRQSDRDFWAYFDAATAAAPTPREKILAFFTSLQEYTTSPACLGCPFINIAVEYPDPAYPGHQVALEHKRLVRQRFLDLARQAGAPRPEELASALHLLMDGAYIAARLYGASPSSPAAHVASAARLLLAPHPPLPI